MVPFQLQDAMKFDQVAFEQLQPVSFLLMLICAAGLGGVLSVIYSFYYCDNEPLDVSLGRSLFLLTPSLMTIFWVTRYSLSLSVGIIGTLSFVRFRSPVKRAEDVAFLLLSIACAVSCSVSQPVFGASLVSLFLVYAVVGRALTKKVMKKRSFAVVTYNTKKTLTQLELEKTIRLSSCCRYEVLSCRSHDGIQSFVFNIAGLNSLSVSGLTKGLKDLDRQADVNVFYPNGRLA